MARRSLIHSAVEVLLILLLLTHTSIVKGDEVCNTSQFECETGKCIPESWLCDGEDDCGDRSDEALCDSGEISTCHAEEFRCSSGLCIPLAWQCDGEIDCPGKDGKMDALDEWDEICNVGRCRDDEFQCRDEGSCIPRGWSCDGHLDCEDGSDEVGCNVTCGKWEFQCLNSDCIQDRWRCDGAKDCSDGSDEINCDNRTCDPKNEFTCKSGMCILSRWRCDVEEDCDDGSDEQDCIHVNWLCDGGIDCPDGSDEASENCGIVKECSQSQFKCKSTKECIPIHLKCSGTVECADGSDEIDCASDLLPPVATNKCDPYKEFNCGPGKACLPKERVCDRVNDCGSWEDEPKELCDQKINECEVNNGGCDQICVDTVDSSFCDCHPGYRLSATTKICEDIDECQIFGSCSQVCHNSIASYSCSCLPGYRVDPSNNSSCRIERGKVGLLFTHQKDIRMTDILGKNTIMVVENTRSATALDFHFRAGQIFWIDSAEKRIYRSEMMDESGKEGTNPPLRMALVEGKVGVGSDGIAVDWINNNLYWTDSGHQTISVTDYNGNYIVDVVTTNLEKPRSLAVHPKKGWMFWSDYGDNPRIEKAGMDGSQRIALVTENVMWPNSICLDLVTDRVYWVDAKLHLIGSVGLDGTRPNIISEPISALYHPISVSVIEDWVFWTEWARNGSSIFRANKFDGSSLDKVIEAAVHHKQMSMVVWHSYRQPTSPSYCTSRNPPCSHICVPAPVMLHAAASHSKRTAAAPTAVCLCPNTHILGTDNATCIRIAIKKTLNSTGEQQDIVEADGDKLYHDKRQTVDLDGEVAQLKRDKDQRNMLMGAVIGIITGIVILTLLVVLWVWTRWFRRSGGSQDSLRKPPVLLAEKCAYSGPVRSSQNQFIPESESTIPLRQENTESDLETA